MKKLSRFVLKTEESLFSVENKTEYDPRLLAFIARADLIIDLTNAIVESTKMLVGPRYSKQMNDMEELGHCMHEAGRSVDHIAESEYGLCLVQVGEIEGRIGRVQKEYALSIYSKYIDPTEDNLKLQLKRMEKEKRALENKRLDLDRSKKNQRNANTNEKRIASCQKVKLAQAEFDREAELLQTMVDGITKTQNEHLVYLKNLVQLQKMYYTKCHSILQELRQELNGQHTSTKL